MSVLTESYEVWLPMPDQDPAIPVVEGRHYLYRTFTNREDALNSLRGQTGAFVVKLTFPPGFTRDIVERPPPPVVDVPVPEVPDPPGPTRPDGPVPGPPWPAPGPPLLLGKNET